MGDWLVAKITIFGVPAQYWELIALAILLLGIVISLWSQR
jgi:hypothetical protein